MAHFYHHRLQRCNNCGLSGHLYRNCSLPITSYGIIAFRYQGAPVSLFSRSAIPPQDPHTIQVLMIKRKNSIAFFEFMRGKYHPQDEEYIGYLIKGMTQSEQEGLLTLSFKELWHTMWNETVSTHKSNYESSEKRFQQVRPRLAQWIQEYPSKWEEPEWGFPKGRRNPHETDITCAIREFQEETSLERSDFAMIQNTHPISETFYGSNQIRYSHKYYLAICRSELEVEVNRENYHMSREIGDIQWVSLEDALTKIRPDNIEKREILLKASKIMKNFYPLSIM